LKGKLLILDDDKIFCDLLRRQLEGEYSVAAFYEPENAVSYLISQNVDVVLTDLSMPGMDGLEMLRIVKSGYFDTDVIIMTAFGNVDTAVQAMKNGAYDYIIKPFSPDEISLQLRNLFEKRKLSEDNLNLRKFVDTIYRPENIIGESEAMKDVYRLIERVSRTDATVLITGESGTGKELVARAIHFSGSRKKGRLVSLNCSAIPETLLEAELFGYEKGAFTGAAGQKKGLFEYADGGTIFLDEISDATASVQAKLLRVLQESNFMPLGGTKEINVDVRVICATNRDLRAMIQENKFREDLFYRINVLTIHLPPLRDREEDVSILIRHFLAGRKRMHPATVAMLSNYSWPGNIRELKNLMERLATFTDADTINIEDLPPEILKLPCLLENQKLSYNEAKKNFIAEFNRTIINKSLQKYNGNVTKAAECLKLDRANFQRLMRKYRISSREFKDTDDPDTSN
jgi:two-component system, NtrC family, response regulator